MIACYILWSQKLDSYYIGITHDGSTNRLQKHNSGFYHNSYTKITDDWELFIEIKCLSVGHAAKIEKHIKRMKSKQYIKNLKIYPELIEKIKNRFE